MTIYEAFSLIAQFSLVLMAVLTLMLGIIVLQNKKK